VTVKAKTARFRNADNITYLCGEAEFLYHFKATRKLVLPAMIVLASSLLLNLKIILCYFQN
jgi:hypothetical protein